MRVLIIGGGIGGMACGVALRQAGIEAVICERAPQLGEIGAGLVVWPNAIKALRALGLVDAVRQVSVGFGPSVIRQQSGSVITHLSTPSLLQDGVGDGGVLIHRAALLDVLDHNLDVDELHLGSECVRVTQDQDGVTASFADGKELRGDVLIGADGLHSQVRERLWQDGPPRFAGYAVWRGITPLPIDARVGTETWGCGLRFGFRSAWEGNVYWYACANTPPGRHPTPDAHKAELQRLFADWHDPIPAIIAASDPDAILYNDIYDRPPLRHWGQGRITLLGDAAHPLTPNLGQGACLAIEDAVVLARTLKAQTKLSGEASNGAAALRQYERLRQGRTRWVAARARHLGQLGQMENPFACRVRNTIASHLPAAIRVRQLERLFDFA